MKTIKNLSIVVALAIPFACQNDQHEVFKELNQNAVGLTKQENPGQRVLLFNAKFVTSLTPTDDPGNCEEPFVIFNNQEGGGKGAHMGNFTTKITFCVNPETFEYTDGQGTFFMESGEELYFTIAGRVSPSDHPKYDLEFHDPFMFTGGTGQFEGASGEGFSNSFVTLFPEGGDQTDHKWKGTLILP